MTNRERAANGWDIPLTAEDTEYLPSYQAREYTKEKIEDNLRKYWASKAIPDCQICSRYNGRCSCGWKVTETEAGPRCFFYRYEFIKEEEYHV